MSRVPPTGSSGTSGGVPVPPSASFALPAASAAIAGALVHARLLGVCLVVSGDFGTRTVFRHPMPHANGKKGKFANARGGGGGGVGGEGLRGGTNVNDNGIGGSTINHSQSDENSNSQRNHITGNGSGVFTGTAGRPSRITPTPSPDSPALRPSESSDGEENGSDLKDNVNGGGGGGGGVSSSSSSHPSSASASSSSSIDTDLYGMSSDEFARLFCPKVALCGRVLDVCIDGLRYVSFPVRLRYDEGRTFQSGVRRKRQRQRLKARQRANRATTTATTTTTASSITAQSTHTNSTPPHPSTALDSSNHPPSSSTTTVGEFLVPPPSSSSPVTSDVDDSTSTACASHDDDDDDEDDDLPPSMFEDEHELTFFNVVFVLSGGVSTELATSYGLVASQLARALLHEQTRAQFVSQQAQLLVSLREKYLHAVSRSNVTVTTSGGVGTSGVTGVGVGGVTSLSTAQQGVKKSQADFHALNHLLLNHSLLAQHLHQLYYGLLQQEFVRFGGGGALGMFEPDDIQHVGLVANGKGMVGSHHTTHPNESMASVQAAFAKLGTQLTNTVTQHNQTMAMATTTPATTTVASSTIARNAATKLLQVDHSHTTLLLNNWFPLHFSLATLPTNTIHHSSSTSTGVGSFDSTPVGQPYVSLDLRPYQTMLLTIPANELLASLPVDSSPLLRQLISTSDPRHSFHTLAGLLHLPIRQVYRLVTHLAYWGKCIVTEAIRFENIYALSEKVGQHHGHGGSQGGMGTTGTGKRLLPSSSSAASSSSSSSSSSHTASLKRAASATRTSNTTSSSSSSSSSNGSKSFPRRRSSSIEHPHMVHPTNFAPSFIPPTLLYEWCGEFPTAGVSGLLSLLTRLSSRDTKTLHHHLTKLTSPPTVPGGSTSSHHGGVGGVGSSSTSIGVGVIGGVVGGVGTNSNSNHSTASNIGGGGGGGGGGMMTTTMTHKWKQQVQNDFLAQLMFLLRKQWIVQVQRWFVRLAPELMSGDDHSDTDDDSEEEDELASRGVLSAASSSRSLRSMLDESPNPSGVGVHTPIAPSDDPWRALFDRLSPLYFDGAHTLTEILWSERESGLTWPHIQHLIHLYPNELITIMHP